MVPSPTDILEWKAKYGNIYSIDVFGQSFVFRSLTVKEQDRVQKALINNASFGEIEDIIIECGVLFPSIEVLNNTKAGVISSLVEEIRSISGIGDAKRAISILNNARAESFKLTNAAKAYILTTMPHYSEEDIDNFTFEQLMHKVALAEKIIELNQTVMMSGGQSIEFMIRDPEEEAAKAAKEEKKKKEMAAKLARTKGPLPVDEESGPILKPKMDPGDPIAAKLRSQLG